MKKQLFIRICKDYNVYNQLIPLISVPTFKFNTMTERHLVFIVAFIKLLEKENLLSEYIDEVLRMYYTKNPVWYISTLPISCNPNSFLFEAFNWSNSKLPREKWSSLNTKWTKTIFRILDKIADYIPKI